MLADVLPEETYPVTDAQDSKASFLLLSTYTVAGKLRRPCRKQQYIQGSLLWHVPPTRNIFITIN